MSDSKFVVRGQHHRGIYITRAYLYNAPKWENPNVENVYVKALIACKDNPGIDDIGLSKVSSVDIWRTLVNYGFIDRKVGEHGKKTAFFIAPPGQEILDEANETKWAYDFLDLVKTFRPKTLVEFDLQMALAGMHNMVEAPMAKRLAEILESPSPAYKHVAHKIERVAGRDFVKELIEFANKQETRA